jgi:4-hydroxythreonine-4-phosphate dehydrogenase
MRPLPLAITMGDPAGIGPEIVVKAFRDAPELTRGCFVAGDVACMRRAAAVLAGPGAPALPVAHIEHPSEALAVPSGCVPVLQAVAPLAEVVLGQVSAAAGRAAGDAVTWAARARANSTW